MVWSCCTDAIAVAGQRVNPARALENSIAENKSSFLIAKLILV